MLGLACTGNYVHLRPMLRSYSEALGIAYQLKDDLEDFEADNEQAHRPSAALALYNEHPDWDKAKVQEELKCLIGLYHQKALDSLAEMDQIELKRLLFQVINELKIES